ncbi:MAG: hypothetical protein AAF741_02625 [Bacteroidota bacterium]
MPFTSLAQETLDFRYELTAEAQTAYDLTLSLHLDEARIKTEELRIDQAGNVAADHIDSYADVLELYITENKDELDNFLDRQEERVIQATELSVHSPWFRYLLAELHLHRAVVLIRFEREWAAFRALNKAHRLLRDNAELFPEFLPTYKDLGLIHAAVGSIPPQYKWGVQLFSSLNGTIAQGKSEMQKMLSGPKDTPFLAEAQVLYGFMHLYLLDDGDAAWEMAQAWQLDPARDKIHCFILSTLAMRSGRNNVADRLLDSQPRDRSALDFPYLDYMLGLVRLRKLDPGSRVYFQSFLSRFKGGNFRRSARQKMAWAEYLRGNLEGYHHQMGLLDERANNRAGSDRNAAREAEREAPPHLGLLKARLLFDGGYYREAREEISLIDVTNLGAADEIEFYYRTGRILHGLKDWNGALSFYERTISLGEDDDSFFACNAALQAGLIEEDQNKKDSARRYFNLCLDMQPDEYRSGLHLQAKAGLNRLK